MHTEVDVPNPQGLLMPGLYAEATLGLGGKNDALAVPLAAMNQVGGASTVFVVGLENRLEARRVTLGLQTANDAEVISGLVEGDRVVVSDRSGLKPGQEVQPESVTPAEYQPNKEQP